jgi:hypothetical protein
MSRKQCSTAGDWRIKPDGDAGSSGERRPGTVQLNSRAPRMMSFAPTYLRVSIAVPGMDAKAADAYCSFHGVIFGHSDDDCQT